MKIRIPVILAGGILLAAQAPAQSVWFDFENASAGSGLPLNLTVSGITAQYSGGYYIQQPQNTILMTPTGFSGNGLIPTSVYGSDLHIGFSKTITNISILYAPQELACDSSATIRVTAYKDDTSVGTTTTNAAAGTWPSETLQFSSMQGFNSVVVHYDKAPVTGGDYGVIFVADNVNVTPAPEPPLLQISTSGNQILVAWPTNTTTFTLQWNTNLLNPGTWLAVTNRPVLQGSNQLITLPRETRECFYRLTWP